MPRMYKYINSDIKDEDGNGPWYSFTYRNPKNDYRLLPQEEVERRQRESMRRQAYKISVRRDEVLNYKYETDIDQAHATRRLLKQPDVLGRHGVDRDYKSVHRWVRQNWNHNREPMVIESENPAACENVGRRTTFREEVYNRRKTDGQAAAAVERRANAGNYKAKTFGKSFIDEVKRARMAHGLSQHDLAQRIHRTEADIKNFENGTLPYEGKLRANLKFALGLMTPKKNEASA